MCEHKHTSKKHFFTGLRCATWDIMSLITEVHKGTPGAQDACCSWNIFYIKINSKCGRFYNLYSRPFKWLTQHKQHRALLYTGSPEHFLVRVRVLRSLKSLLFESYLKNSSVDGYCTDVACCFQHYTGRNSYRLREEYKLRSGPVSAWLSVCNGMFLPRCC